jgi:hypothetical protein
MIVGLVTEFDSKSIKAILKRWLGIDHFDACQIRSDSVNWTSATADLFPRERSALRAFFSE